MVEPSGDGTNKKEVRSAVHGHKGDCGTPVSYVSAYVSVMRPQLCSTTFPALWCSAKPQAHGKRPRNHGLKPLKAWAKMKLASFSVDFFQVFCHSNGKQTQNHRQVSLWLNWSKVWVFLGWILTHPKYDITKHCGMWIAASHPVLTSVGVTANVNLYNHYGNQYGGSSKNWN